METDVTSVDDSGYFVLLEMGTDVSSDDNSGYFFLFLFSSFFGWS